MSKNVTVLARTLLILNPVVEYVMELMVGFLSDIWEEVMKCKPASIMIMKDVFTYNTFLAT